MLTCRAKFHNLSPLFVLKKVHKPDNKWHNIAKNIIFHEKSIQYNCHLLCHL